MRQNNRSATRTTLVHAGKIGYSFFQDDEDEFGLADVLTAMVFHDTGAAYVAAKPWAADNNSTSHCGGTLATYEWQLPIAARGHLNRIRNACAIPALPAPDCSD